MHRRFRRTARLSVAEWKVGVGRRDLVGRWMCEIQTTWRLYRCPKILGLDLEYHLRISRRCRRLSYQRHHGIRNFTKRLDQRRPAPTATTLVDVVRFFGTDESGKCRRRTKDGGQTRSDGDQQYLGITQYSGAYNETNNETHDNNSENNNHTKDNDDAMDNTTLATTNNSRATARQTSTKTGKQRK